MPAWRCVREGVAPRCLYSPPSRATSHALYSRNLTLTIFRGRTRRRTEGTQLTAHARGDRGGGRGHPTTKAPGGGQWAKRRALSRRTPPLADRMRGHISR
eukprot:scaffold297_cov108-Isochrysis_galbana.AAC.3